MTDLIPTSETALALAQTYPLDQNPAAVYLASLTSKGSQRTQRAALDKIAILLTGGKQVDCLAVDWSKLRYQHAAAIRRAVRSILRNWVISNPISSSMSPRAASTPAPSRTCLYGKC
jgi:hypothetical protein